MIGCLIIKVLCIYAELFAFLFFNPSVIYSVMYWLLWPAPLLTIMNRVSEFPLPFHYVFWIQRKALIWVPAYSTRLNKMDHYEYYEYSEFEWLKYLLMFESLWVFFLSHNHHLFFFLYFFLLLKIVERDVVIFK